jgi:hypothetical protein
VITCNLGCPDRRIGVVNLPSLAVAIVAVLSVACSNQSSPTELTNHPGGLQVSQVVHSREPATNTSTFAVGSSASQVKAAMGAPDEMRTRAGGMEVWSYKFSSVSFRNGRVVGWEDHSKVLRTQGNGDTRIAENYRESRDGQSYSVTVPSGVTAIPGGSSASRSSAGATNSSVQFVEGHQRSDGSTVRGYYRTTGDSNRTNNFSSRGNVNPYTGRRGSR